MGGSAVKRRLYWLASIIPITLILVSACSSAPPPRPSGPVTYETYVLAPDDIRYQSGGIILEHPRFSFDYPSSFVLLDVNRGRGASLSNPDYTQIYFSRSVPNKLADVIVVEVLKPGLSSMKDALGAADFEVKSHADANLKVRERSTKTAAGITAEYVAYSFEVPGPATRFIRFLAFDYKGFIWTIRLSCYEDSAQETALYFDRLVETFKFLE